MRSVLPSQRHRRRSRGDGSQFFPFLNWVVFWTTHLFGLEFASALGSRPASHLAARVVYGTWVLVAPTVYTVNGRPVGIHVTVLLMRSSVAPSAPLIFPRGVSPSAFIHHKPGLMDSRLCRGKPCAVCRVPWLVCRGDRVPWLVACGTVCRGLCRGDLVN